MKTFLIICSLLLFVALADLPIGYYTLLRIAVTVCGILVVIKEYRDDLNFWVIVFGLLVIAFNPIIPVYLHDKSAWTPIDIAGAVLCLVRALTWKSKVIS